MVKITDEEWVEKLKIKVGKIFNTFETYSKTTSKGRSYIRATAKCIEANHSVDLSASKLSEKETCPTCDKNNYRKNLEATLDFLREDFYLSPLYLRKGKLHTDYTCKVCGERGFRNLYDAQNLKCTHMGGSSLVPIDEQITKATKIWGDRFSYGDWRIKPFAERPNAVYIDVTCNTCENTTEKCMRGVTTWGCAPCSHKEAELTPEEIVEGLSEVHGDKFLFSNMRIEGNNLRAYHNRVMDKTCKTCGDTSTVHVYGGASANFGCETCGQERSTAYLREHPRGHSEEAWRDIFSKTELTDLTYSNFRSLMIYGSKAAHVDVLCHECNREWTTTCVSISLGTRCTCKTKSKGEVLLESILTNKGYSFEAQKMFPDMRYKRLLKCDAYLPEFNLIIEVQGYQHTRPIDFYGGEEGFRITQARDLAKRTYAKENNINFMEIHYSEISISQVLKRELMEEVFSTKMEELGLV